MKSRPSTAPICATSRAEPSRSSRAASDCCSVGGIACAPPSTPRSSKSRVTSSTNSGTPPVRSLTPSTTSFDSAWREDISPTMRATSARSRGASATTLWCERMPHGGRNSGRAVATMKSGASAPRSARARMRSSEVGSAQCRSSKAIAIGCCRAAASVQAVIAANCRRRSSSGAKLKPRPGGNGMSTIGAMSGAYSAASRPMRLSVFSRSARRWSAGVSAPPNRSRPHSATGCRGVFCNNCEDDHSEKVCGVSPSLKRNSSTSRDLPMPGLADDRARVGHRLSARAPSALRDGRAPPLARRAV